MELNLITSTFMRYPVIPFIEMKVVITIIYWAQENGGILEKPRPGKTPKIREKEIALISTIACSEVPSGRSTWTLRMIADKFVELSEVDSVCRETIRSALKKTN